MKNIFKILNIIALIFISLTAVVSAESGEWSTYLGYVIDTKPEDIAAFTKLSDFLDRLEDGHADQNQTLNSPHNLWVKKLTKTMLKSTELADKKITSDPLVDKIKLRKFAWKKLECLFLQIASNKDHFSVEFLAELAE